MRGFLPRAAILIGIFAALLTPVSAQWPPYPTPEVPRTPDGEPDLEGPTPRTADGKPDLSGIWERLNGQRGPVEGQLGRGPKVSPPADSPPRAHFFDIGAQTEVPYTRWADELTEQRMADNAQDNPDAYCLPIGHMLYHLHPQPRKVIQTPDVIVILYEANSGVRQIFTDGRSLPDDDPLPWWFGYSVGSWEGDTLVVETTGFRDDVWIDYNGSPLTSSGKITERFRRVNFGTLEIDITIEDPMAYTEPFTVRVNQRIMLDTNLIEFVCLENEVSSQFF
jgi:hypothetical protein